MKKTVLRWSLLLLLGMFLIPSLHATDKVQRIVVHTEAEFLRALGSNRVVVLPEHTHLNLSHILEDPERWLQAGLFCADGVEFPPEALAAGLKSAEPAFDGYQLLLTSMHHLTIEGEGNTRPSIVIEPRYAYIFRFAACQDITLRHLEIGHTPEGFCLGGVLSFEDSQQIVVDDCSLYGCGTEGITTKRVQQLHCKATDIHHCSYSIFTLEQSDDVRFDNCRFYRNREYSLVNVFEDCSGITLNRCQIFGNQGELFALQSPIRMEQCVVCHPESSLGNLRLIEDIGCRWNPSDFASPLQPDPSQAADFIRSHCWTDGCNAFYLLPDDQLANFGLSRYDRSDRIVLTGGSMSEGGYLMSLCYRQESVWVESEEEYSTYPNGSIVEPDYRLNLLFIRDKDTRRTIDVYHSIVGMYALSDAYSFDLQRLMLAGKYRDAEGRIYEFSSADQSVKGFSDQEEWYEFDKNLETPQPVLVLGDTRYLADKTPTGLSLCKVVRSFETTYKPAGKPFLLTRIAYDTCDYPLLSTDYLSQRQLAMAAGLWLYSFRSYDQKAADALEMLAQMRNQIYATHGYRFRSPKWVSYFGSKSWYHPTSDNVDALLTPIERSNLQLIQNLEKQIKK